MRELLVSLQVCEMIIGMLVRSNVLEDNPKLKRRGRIGRNLAPRFLVKWMYSEVMKVLGEQQS